MPDSMVTRKLRCNLCLTYHDVTLDPADVARWRFGMVQIQEALHYLTADERELLITGTCGDCYDRVLDIERYDEDPEEDEDE